MLDFLILEPIRVLGYGLYWEDLVQSLNSQAWDDIALAYGQITGFSSSIEELRKNFLVRPLLVDLTSY
jgi:hypothetical protein